MLRCAAGFFVIAVIAAVLGFGGIAAGASGIAKLLFFVFVLAFLISLMMGLVSRAAFNQDSDDLDCLPREEGMNR